MKIRTANKDDFEMIYYFMCLLENKTLNKDYLKKAFEKGIEDEDTFYFICEQGFISLHRTYYLYHNALTGEIVELVVNEQARGQKIGEQLIQHVESFSKEIGLEELNLCTSTYRKRAHHFYETHDYIMNHYNYVKKLND